jgi:hypothetical protein
LTPAYIDLVFHCQLENTKDDKLFKPSHSLQCTTSQQSVQEATPTAQAAFRRMPISETVITLCLGHSKSDYS